MQAAGAKTPGVPMAHCNLFGSLLAAFRLRSSEPDDAASDAGGFSHGTASPLAGPLVNVEGTPMLNGTVAVMGKPYGDAGSMFSGTDIGGISTTARTAPTGERRRAAAAALSHAPCPVALGDLDASRYCRRSCLRAAMA